MRCGRWWLLALIAIWNFGLTAAELQVDAQCPWVDRAGYTPVVITVRSGLPTPTAVQIDATLYDNRSGMVIEVPAGGVVTRTLLLPGAAQRWGSSLDVRWRAPGFSSEQLSVSPRGFREVDVVVIDPDEQWPVPESRTAIAAAVGPSRDPSGGGSTSAYAEYRFNRWAPSSLPDRWQGFPAWLSIISTPAGDRALTDGQRAAIAAWTHAGGRLFATDVSQIVAWQNRGALVSLVEKSRLIERIKSVWSQQERSFEDAPVPGTGRVPVYGFVTIALLFSLLVGPANMWWCARKGRRHLILVTTPLISLIASAVLLTYGLVSDGLGIQRSVIQVISLDQTTGRAATWTAMTIFAGLAPGALALDQEVLLTVQNPREDRYGSTHDSPVSLQWNATGQQAVGWIPSRVNRQLTFASVQPEKRRLLFAKDGNSWQVTNGFEAVLEDFGWRDPQGRYWHLAGSLAAGAAGQLTAGSAVVAPPLGRFPTASLQAIEGGAWTARFSGALLTIPGPVASDAVPVTSWVVGRGVGMGNTTNAEPAAESAPGAF